MKRYFAVFAAVLLMGLPVWAQFGGPEAKPLRAESVPQAQLMQPQALNKILTETNSNGPLIVQVGSRVMFDQAHIPMSVYAGPGSQAGGLELLANAVRKTPKNRLIVIYCGCCPWDRCPNIGPAYKKLRDLGFTSVKALYIANNFGDDWVAKGYVTEKGR